MEKAKSNNFELYKILVYKPYATDEDLYYLGYRKNDIKDILERKVIRVEDNKYYIGDVFEVYYYFDMLIGKRENALAKNFYNKIMELKPDFKPEYHRLIKIATTYEDFYAAYQYSKLLKEDGFEKESNLYICLLSNIIKVPKDDVELVKGLNFADIKFDDDKEELNKISEAIFKQKFAIAVSLINKKGDSFNKDILKELCFKANEEKIKEEMEIHKRLTDGELDVCEQIIKRNNKYRNLNENEVVIYHLLRVYKDIQKGIKPELKDERCDNLISALRCHNYESALGMVNKDSSIHLLLNKIVERLKIDPKRDYETSENCLNVYGEIMPLINNVIITKDIEVLDVNDENQKQMILEIVKSYDNVKALVVGSIDESRIILKYVDRDSDLDRRECSKNASKAYKNYNYDLALLNYKRLLSSTNEPILDNYFKIAKCYHELGNIENSDKYLEASYWMSYGLATGSRIRAQVNELKEEHESVKRTLKNNR